jgi:predicted outer membrane protein
VIRKFMMGLAAAGLVSMAPMTVSAHMQESSSSKYTHKKTTSMPMGTFKYKAAKRKPGTYGSSKSAPQ